MACYDFENVTDRVPDVSGGMHDLKAFVGEVSDGPAGWEHGVVCEPGSCFAGQANIDLGNVGFTLEVWARLTRTKLELDEHGDLFTIIAAGGEGMGVRAGRAGSEAPSLYAHFLGTRQQLFGGRADTEYRCIAVTWAGDGSAMVRLVGSDGSTDDTEIQEGAAGPDLTDALLQLGDAEGLVPAEVIGVRVWNRPVAQPCTNPGVPR